MLFQAMLMPASNGLISRNMRRFEMHRHATQSTVPMPTEVASVESPATHFSCMLRGAPLLCFDLLQREFGPRDILLWLRRTCQFLPTLYLNSRAPRLHWDPIQPSYDIDQIGRASCR